MFLQVVTSLGGELVDDIHSCTHLVTDKVGTKAIYIQVYMAVRVYRFCPVSHLLLTPPLTDRN